MTNGIIFNLTAKGCTNTRSTLHSSLVTKNGNQSTSASAPTIGVDIFKELINDMKIELNTNLVNVNAKLDSITTRIHYQDRKISDLGQRI